MSKIEYLDILDQENRKIGVASRSEAHAKGLIHRVVHCWVISQKQDGIWVWFQQRSHSKSDFPGFYDIAVGGHVDAGEEIIEAVTREMREEIGLRVRANDLCYLGAFRDDICITDFDDRELAEVYLYLDPAPIFQIGEEVNRMIRIPLEILIRKEQGTVKVVTGYTDLGEGVEILPEEWCRHDGEVEKFILPALTKMQLK